MSQNARVALWVPTVVPSTPQESVVSTAAPDALGRLPSEFRPPIADVPLDGVTYARKNRAWAEIDPGGGGGGIPEAPSDGKLYGRSNETWVEVTSGPTGGIPDAPADGESYARVNGAWSLMDGGTF